MVASLLSNTPNIAGLVRSSEIFNLECLVISNEKILKTVAFKKMSVSAGISDCASFMLIFLTFFRKTLEHYRSKANEAIIVFTRKKRSRI